MEIVVAIGSAILVLATVNPNWITNHLYHVIWPWTDDEKTKRQS